MTQHSLINDHACIEGNVWILWDSLTRPPMYRGYHCVASPNWNSWGAAKTQGHRILNLGCQRNTRSLCHPILNSAPLPRFFFLPSDSDLFCFLQFLSLSPPLFLAFSSVSPPPRLLLICSLRCSSIHPEPCFFWRQPREPKAYFTGGGFSLPRALRN